MQWSPIKTTLFKIIIWILSLEKPEHEILAMQLSEYEQFENKKLWEYQQRKTFAGALVDSKQQKLYQAIQENKQSMILQALVDGADINKMNNGIDPLQSAITKGNQEIITLLLNNGAHVAQHHITQALCKKDLYEIDKNDAHPDITFFAHSHHVKERLIITYDKIAQLLSQRIIPDIQKKLPVHIAHLLDNEMIRHEVAQMLQNEMSIENVIDILHQEKITKNIAQILESEHTMMQSPGLTQLHLKCIQDEILRPEIANILQPGSISEELHHFLQQANLSNKNFPILVQKFIDQQVSLLEKQHKSEDVIRTFKQQIVHLIHRNSEPQKYLCHELLKSIVHKTLHADIIKIIQEELLLQKIDKLVRQKIISPTIAAMLQQQILCQTQQQHNFQTAQNLPQINPERRLSDPHEPSSHDAAARSS